MSSILPKVRLRRFPGHIPRAQSAMRSADPAVRLAGRKNRDTHLLIWSGAGHTRKYTIDRVYGASRQREIRANVAREFQVIDRGPARVTSPRITPHPRPRRHAVRLVRARGRPSISRSVAAYRLFVELGFQRYASTTRVVIVVR